MTKSVEGVKKERKSNQYAILQDLKIINYATNATNVKKKRWLAPISDLIKKFSNTYKFWNNDISKFILLIQKGAYPYEYMDSWERFNEISLPDKKVFIVNYILKTLLMKTVNMLKKYLKNLTSKI